MKKPIIIFSAILVIIFVAAALLLVSQEPTQPVSQPQINNQDINTYSQDAETITTDFVNDSTPFPGQEIPGL